MVWQEEQDREQVLQDAQQVPQEYVWSCQTILQLWKVFSYFRWVLQWSQEPKDFPHHPHLFINSGGGGCLCLAFEWRKSCILNQSKNLNVLKITLSLPSVLANKDRNALSASMGEYVYFINLRHYSIQNYHVWICLILGKQILTKSIKYRHKLEGNWENSFIYDRWMG